MVLPRGGDEGWHPTRPAVPIIRGAGRVARLQVARGGSRISGLQVVLWRSRHPVIINTFPLLATGDCRGEVSLRRDERAMCPGRLKAPAAELGGKGIKQAPV